MDRRDSTEARSEMAATTADDFSQEVVPNRRFLILNQLIASSPSDRHKVTGKWGNLLLAYKTLGVVFGGLVTSPLYVFPSMPLKSPTEEDYLGIYCLIFWTLSLIGVVKYANVAIRADDQGEGGTFALYSLLCRNIDIGILPTKRLDANSPIPSSSLYEGKGA